MTFQVKYMEEVFLEPPITSHQPGQTLANLKATILELVNKHDEEYRKEREHFYIIIFNSFHDGMNKKNWILRFSGFYHACDIVHNYSIKYETNLNFP